MIHVDLHAHTLMSQCGVHTHLEMLQAARDRGLTGLAITDHGPALSGRHPSPVYERLDQPVPGIRFLKGIEANVTDADGATDIPMGLLPLLDVVLLGLHLRFDHPGAPEDWTGPLVNALCRNPFVDIITHPVDTQFPLDLYRLATAAREHGMALELNNSKRRYGRIPEADLSRFLSICRDTGCRIVISSDAHTIEEIGDDSAVRPLLEASGIPEDRIVNATAVSAFRFIESRRQQRRSWIEGLATS